MKFSMIMPVHNAEKLMRKALDSIAAQTFKDYELICICDACEDNSEAIAREYGAIVIPVDYHRPGLSRNKGLEVAQGDWILFMDDDDWLPRKDVFGRLAGKVGTHGEDILMCAFDWKGHGHIIQDARRHYAAVWNKAWRREFIGDTRFPDWTHGDDAGFDVKMMNKNPKVWYWDYTIYYYNWMREGSLTDLEAKGLI